MEVIARPVLRRPDTGLVDGSALAHEGASAWGYLLSKRALDIAIASVALVLLSPVFLLVALVVRLDGRGPVIYRRRVASQNGHSPHPIDPKTVETFDAYKFRTMTPDADSVLVSDERLLSEYGENFKLENDPRVTRVGRFLRKSNLDELPQFLNVLRGQMSVVGPRIVTPPELEKYGPTAARLLSVRPGMSGLWQVLRGDDHSYENRVEHDMAYIGCRTIWLDVRIVLMTVGLVLRMRGSG